MAEKIFVSDTGVKRETGILYYLKTNEETGNLEVWATLLSRNGRPNKKKRMKRVESEQSIEESNISQ